VEIGAGDFGAISANAAAAAPVGDQSAVRFAVLHQESDGAFDNVFTQRDDGAIDLTSARALLRWQPTEPLDVLLNARWGRNRGEIRPQKPAYPAASTLPPSSLPPAYQPPIDNCPQGAPTDGSFRSGCSDQFGFGLTDTPGFHDTQTSFTSIEDVDTHGFSAEVNWKLGRHTLTSVTAWDTADSRRYNDTDGNELALLHQTDFVDTDFYSQELRLASNYEGAFNWIGGAYFYGDEMDSQFMFDLRDHGAGLGGLIPPLTPTGGFGASTPVGIAQNVHQETESWAMFGEGTYSFAERWEATLGLRVTGDERQAEVNSFVFNSALVPDNAPVSYDQALDASAPPALGIPFPLTLISSTSVEKSWTKWSGRAALKYELADDQMMFLSVSHGFRGGEFNGGAIFGAEQAVITDPEFVDSVDLGYKGRLLDDRVQLNATAFYMEITDQQVQVFTPAGAGILPTIVNAGESTIKGLELDVQWRPLEAWFFMFSTAYLDAEFRKFFDPTINLDRSGNALPDSPEWTFDGVARYEVPIGSGRLALQVDGRWQDDVFFTAENNPALVQDSFGVVNFRGSYTFPGERFMASVFVRNAFDEEYLLGAYDTTNAFAANIFLPADPRTYGIALRYTW
jgi:iron complex outermembrane receptor protein